MFPEITKRELILGLGIFAAIIVLAILISSHTRDGWERKYITFGQALKVTESGKLSYGIKTNVGNILAYGPIKATVPQTYPDIKGEYAVIGMETERYTMHTRIVSCGKNCFTTQTYYTWDHYSDDYHKTPEYTVLDTKLRICELDTNRLDLKDNYTGSKKQNGNYVYDKDPFWNHVGDKRYYWMVAPKELNGSVLLRAFNDKITDPFGKNCLKVYPDETIEQRVSNAQPHYGKVWVISLIAITILTTIYFIIAYRQEIL